MAIKKYSFDYDLGEADALFEVDTEKFTEEMANATLEFFSWDYDKKANPIDEVMKKYAMRAIEFATFNNHNAYGVKSDFENAEGFAKVDGSVGVTLIRVNGYEFSYFDLEMTVN